MNFRANLLSLGVVKDQYCLQRQYYSIFAINIQEI